MLTTILSNIVTLLAAAIGGYFALRSVSRSHNLDRAAQAARDQEIAERVRTMLILEIEENRQAFEKYDLGIDDRVLFNGGNHQALERAKQLSHIPLPDWKHHYWEALTPSIPNALSKEEIERCHKFHSALDELTRIKNIPRQVHGTWFNVMDQTMRTVKELKNPLATESLVKN